MLGDIWLPFCFRGQCWTADGKSSKQHGSHKRIIQCLVEDGNGENAPVVAMQGDIVCVDLMLAPQIRFWSQTRQNRPLTRRLGSLL